MTADEWPNPLDFTKDQWAAIRWYDAVMRMMIGETDDSKPVSDRAVTAIIDIAAHSTPFGEDDEGFVSGGYLVSVGAMHRALGVVGHSAAPCPACPITDPAP